MQFIGPPLTFAVNLINEGAGLIGPKAFANGPNGVFFMSKNAFYFYNGSVKKLPCSVQDYVFGDLDVSQAFKCFAGLNEEFSEIWFFYPSNTDNTDEISRYVIYNYEENSWSIGTLERYSWLNSGINEKPLAAGESSDTKYIYEHEKGANNDSSSMDNVFIESADIDMTDGESFVFLKKIIPDILFQTETGTSPTPAVNVVVKRRDFNGQSLSTDSTTQIGTSSTFSSLRTRTRQFVLRFESDDDNSESDRKDFKWRLGDTRLDIQPSGRR
jgi:NADH:ubiquinone oxidoreductase subunit